MTNLDRAAADYAAARTVLEMARDQLATAIRESFADGMSESELARRAGVTRMTVRAWLKR
jgi:DNA-binding transcriptional regulator YiaG